MEGLKKYVLIQHGDSGQQNTAAIAIGESNLRTLVEKTIYGDVEYSNLRIAEMDCYMSDIKHTNQITFEGDPPLTLAILQDSL